MPVSSLRKSAARYSLPRFDGSLRFAVRLPSLGRRFSFFAAGVLEFENFAVDKSIAASHAAERRSRRDIGLCTRAPCRGGLLLKP